MMIPNNYTYHATLPHMDVGEYCSTESMVARPVAFASCTLTKSQRNYSQLDKEAFSIIFCLKRFHKFLYGRLFHIIADHKLLVQLLGEHKPVPVHTAARLQRYPLILASYNYKLEFRSTNITSMLMRYLAYLFLLHLILCQIMSTATSLPLLLILIRTVLRD